MTLKARGAEIIEFNYCSEFIAGRFWKSAIVHGTIHIDLSIWQFELRPRGGYPAKGNANPATEEPSSNIIMNKPPRIGIVIHILDFSI